ncbi:LamG-like jellyroll fold domain-containing protein [Muribaculum intestinale]|uniref:LamG-like jellyroll fold domain-containing protein n=1 Tax=Muribaculum intestinale TaxID=1796646 RepID=UPI00259C95BF|nr:hypothetical protein [Muribaculum intestinale]
MKRHHWKSDLLLSETFYNLEGSIRKQVAVPAELRIDYFTDPCGARFTVERHGAECTNCFVSEDGMTLTAAVPLSRQPVGEGSLYHLITEYVQDGNFPEGKRAVATPGVTDVILTTGASDESAESVSESVLQTVMYGYSAYQLAVLNGYEGTEEEYIKAPILAQEAIEEFRIELAAFGKILWDTVRQRQITSAVMGKGLFKSSAPALTTALKEQPHTTVVLFTTPSAAEVGMKGIYNEGPDNTTGFGTFIWCSGGNVVVSIRGGNYKTTQVPPQTLCMAALSYRNDRAIMAINGAISIAENPPYPYAHNPQRVLVGGTERDSTNGRLCTFRVVAVRKFNFAATADQLTDMWNGGHPELWTVPDRWRDAAGTDRVLLDLSPAGLTPTVWYDMSGQEHDMPYLLNGNKVGEAELSYDTTGFADMTAADREVVLAYANRYDADREAVLVRMADANAGRALAGHAADAVKHVTASERSAWNAKADLDKTGHVTPQQIAPQQGRQQGTCTEYGYYKSDASSLNPAGSQTHVVTFVTGDDVTAAQTVAAGKNFAFTIAGRSIVSPVTGGGLAPVIARKLYQAVCVIDDEAQKASLYLNGVFVAASATFQASTALFIGRYNDTNFRQFKGTVVDYRQFSFAMSAGDVAEVWNCGRPMAWRVPAELGLCTAAFEPESLLPDSWRNLIKGGADLRYMSYEEDTVAVFDYVAAEEPYTTDVVCRGVMTTSAVMGMGLFNSSAPSLTQKNVQHTTALLFVAPSAPTSSMKGLYNEGPDGTTGYGTYIWYSGGNVNISCRGLNVHSQKVTNGTLCLVVISYDNDRLLTSINGEVKNTESPSFAYDHNPRRMIIGGTENDASAGNLVEFRAVAVRRFNFAMNEEQIQQIFNNGRPELWQVPDVWRNIAPSKWPTTAITESKDTWRVNHTTMTVENDVAAANGFSGKFQRFTKGTGTSFSIFNGWRNANYGSGAERATWQFVTVEYRCDAAANLTSGLPVPTSLPANTGNAKTVTVLCAAGNTVNISTLNDAGTYLEVRTTKIWTVGCILDLVPKSLTPKLWRDASGQGNDIPYVQASANPAECVLSCEQVAIPQSITDAEKQAIEENVKKSLPTSYPANGGNSDTVDGKHADNFVNVVIPNNSFTTGSIENFIIFLQQSGVFPANQQGSSSIWFPFNFPGAITSAFGTIVLGGAKVTVDTYAANQFMLTIQTAESGIAYQYTPMFGLVTAAGAIPNGLTISLNGKSQGAFNGSVAKSIDITPDGIGAIPALGFPSTARQTTYLRWNLGVATTLYVPGSNPVSHAASGHSSNFMIRPGDPVYVLGFNPSLPLNENGLTVMAQTSQEVDTGKIVFQPDSNINLVGATIFTAVPIGYSTLRITGFMFFPTPGITYLFTK